MGIYQNIQNNKESLLNRWIELSRAHITPASDKTHHGMRDHIPQLIDELVGVLETRVFDKPIEVSKIHGEQRFNFGDYTLTDVLNEYSILKNVVFDFVESLNQAATLDFRLISKFFDSASTIAATQFAALRERELKDITKNLRSSNDDLERFSAVAAHDLKSPLSTIIGYADLALDDSFQDTDNIKPVETIRNVAYRMNLLIDQLFEYTKIGKSEVKRLPFSITEAAEHAVTNLHKQIKETESNVTIGKLPDYVGDLVLFTQMFQNLISNSIKFRSSKRVSRIEIGAKEKNKSILIYVKDNGLGFNSELDDQIFEPFKRGKNIANIKGSGLGLATVKKIIELHDGKIEVHGEEDVGTEFTITLPMLKNENSTKK